MAISDEFQSNALEFITALRSKDRGGVEKHFAVLKPRLEKTIGAIVHAWPSLFRTTHALTPEDALQDILLRVWDFKPREQPANPRRAATTLIAWTKLVAQNYLLDLHRKRTTREGKDHPEPEDPVSSNYKSRTEERLAAASQAKQAGAILREHYPLGYELYQVLSVEPDLTVPEQAQRLEKNATYIYKIRQRMRDVLAAHLSDDD